MAEEHPVVEVRVFTTEQLERESKIGWEPVDTLIEDRSVEVRGVSFETRTETQKRGIVVCQRRLPAALAALEEALREEVKAKTKLGDALFGEQKAHARTMAALRGAEDQIASAQGAERNAVRQYETTLADARTFRGQLNIAQNELRRLRAHFGEAAVAAAFKAEG